MIPRYSRPEMARLWEPEAKFSIWLKIETLAAEALAKLGLIPAAPPLMPKTEAHPGGLPTEVPDGVRPGVLAERAGMSKQAMNQLLRSLEGLGYLARSAGPEGSRARIIHLTRRGREAYEKIHEILQEIEREWSTELGPRDFTQLKKLLLRAWNSVLIK